MLSLFNLIIHWFASCWRSRSNLKISVFSWVYKLMMSLCCGNHKVTARLNILCMLLCMQCIPSVLGFHASGNVSTGRSLSMWRIAAIIADEVGEWHHYDDVIMRPAHLAASNRKVPKDISVMNENLLVLCLFSSLFFLGSLSSSTITWI